MVENYLESKKFRKKKARPYLWLFIIGSVIFIIIMIRFAHTGIRFVSTGLPTSTEAFSVAKDFVRSTVRSNDVTFPSSGFQFAKKTDSIYVIRSAVETKSESGETKTTTFKVVMQYKGGKQDEQRNWSLLNISED